MTGAIFGPIFEEMLHPGLIDPAVRQQAVSAMAESPPDPINPYNSPATGRR
ncbi:MAG TPA: hypothetical protein VIM99_09715 [Blastocatellia bacterium]